MRHQLAVAALSAAFIPALAFGDGFNVAYGTDVLPALTTGQRNAGFGTSVGLYVTTASDDVLVGLGTQYVGTGSATVAVGNYAAYNVTGTENTAIGFSAMSSDANLSGSYQTAVGSFALYQSTGSENTGVGYQTLFLNQASGLTAVGSNALHFNTTGASNTALGQYAAYQTTTGSDNVAIGSEALRYNTTGSQNMALGRSALRNSSSAGFNSVIGYASCWSCKSASQNVGIGFKTLYSLSSGIGNVAVGNAAGYNLTGSNNVVIANSGISGDSGIIRIGAASTHTKAYIAGIVNSKVTGSPVYITSDGQLGTQASALRYKTEVNTLPDPAERLSQLRPVSFHLKNDPNGPLQYGLIAEEVANVYPDLVIRDEKGVTQGVRYDELAPMLLKQLQGQQQELLAQSREILALQTQAAELVDLKARLTALETTAKTSALVVAAR